MAVNILDTDALDKMGQIEGDLWRRDQEIDGGIFEGFKALCEELLANSGSQSKLSHIEIEGHPCIGGFGGLNRYFVKPGGEIIFAKKNAKSDADVQKATELGFTTI